ncbi:MAG TPA: MarR family transcriptional regulator [Acidimicrobiia bacterium]|nr:MarR family transcriptional regulator [Acidimicrobiia bacterium]
MLKGTPSSEVAASEEALADALRLVIGRVARRLRQQSLGDMTPSQRSVLASLDRHGSLRIGELARIENISAPSLSGIVGRLETRGLVTRTGDPDDARSTIVEVTPLAVEAIAEARAERNAFLRRRLSTLSREEQKILARSVTLLEGIAEDP